MNSKQNLFMALFAILAISTTMVSGNGLSWAHQESNLHLMSLMSRSNDIMQRDPSRSLDCFGYYIPLINKIVDDYQTNFNGCLETSRVSRKQVEDDTLDKRKDLAGRASTSCEVLSQCVDIESAEKVFECYVNGGSENAKRMYSINADATEHLEELKESLRLIQVNEHKCTNETKRTYEADSAQAYKDFNDCVLGLSTVPTPTDAPATDSPATDSPATDPPATDAPATDPPATDAPATDAPATDAPATDAPEVAPEDKLPEEDIYLLRQALRSRLQQLRV